MWEACIKEPGLIAGDTVEERLWTLLHSLRVTHRNGRPHCEEVVYNFGSDVRVRAVSMPTRAITVLLGDEEIPFAMLERTNTDNGKDTVPRDVLGALSTVVEYLWDDEREDCCSCEREPATQHIFNSLVIVKKLA